MFTAFKKARAYLPRTLCFWDKKPTLAGAFLKIELDHHATRYLESCRAQNLLFLYNSSILRDSAGLAISCPMVRIIDAARSVICELLNWPARAY